MTVDYMVRLRKSFIDLCSIYCDKQTVIHDAWKALETYHEQESRYYHNLIHLDRMFNIISPFEFKLSFKNATLFAVWFHDIIYNSNAGNNEEASSFYAMNTMIELGVPDPIVMKTGSLILLTKYHAKGTDCFDENLFMDADLSILGSSPDEYFTYREAIRKEYAQYTDEIYNNGRKKVLEKFLNMKYIFKTVELREALEEKAKRNIKDELDMLLK